MIKAVLSGGGTSEDDADAVDTGTTVAITTSCDADRYRHPRGDCQGADPSDTPAVAHRRVLPSRAPG
jgi:hypothetical protein